MIEGTSGNRLQRPSTTVCRRWASVLRILELFCGIGGVAEAVWRQPSLGRVVQAVDIDRHATLVYAANHSLRPTIATIESAASWRTRIAGSAADTWWLSPPCQPYCVRGRQAPDDARRAALLQIIRIVNARPDWLPCRFALENVPAFEQSDDCSRLLSSLDAAGYQTNQQTLCPSQWGIPNRRQRFYLTAWLSNCKPPAIVPPTRPTAIPLARYLDRDHAPDLFLDLGLQQKFAPGLDIVSPHGTDRPTSCFTAGYGKSIKQAGSYLAVAGRLRRFSCREVQRLLGYRDTFAWPSQCTHRQRWKLLGNSLSIDVVRQVLASLAVENQADIRR